MKKKHSNLGIYFVLIIFFIMFASALIMVGVTFILFHRGQLQQVRNPMLPIIFLLFMSLVIGTTISGIIAKRILRPITALSEAASVVAKGDFAIQVEENERIKEINVFIHNFNLMVKELSSIETLRSDFVVNVSHEFKTPLAAIGGYATLLQENNLAKEDRQEYTKMIIDSAKQLTTLTDHILKLSKLENQELVVDKSEFRLDEQIREAVLLLENKWQEKHLDMEVALENVTCCSNKNLLMQIWINLLDNAIKFTPPGGSVGVKLKEIGGNILVSVQDSGKGIPPEEMKHIFDKFYQGDSARSSTGNGLGLALVKRIVELCGGSIEVHSLAEEGSEFVVMLPQES